MITTAQERRRVRTWDFSFFPAGLQWYRCHSLRCDHGWSHGQSPGETKEGMWYVEIMTSSPRKVAYTVKISRHAPVSRLSRHFLQLFRRCPGPELGSLHEYAGAVQSEVRGGVKLREIC